MDARANWLVQMRAERALAELLPALSARGVEAMVVKGVALAHSLYEDQAARPISDVDVRIRPSKLHHVRTLAGERGWKVVMDAPVYDNMVLEIQDHQVDIEGHVGPPYVSALGIGEFFERATPQVFASGFTALVPSVEDHAILLTLNIFKDKITSAASWAIEDVRRIVSAPGFDENVFLARVSEAGIRTITRIVASHMASLGSQSWASILRALGPETRPVYARLVRRAFTERASKTLATRVLARVGADSPRARLKALAFAARWEFAHGLARRGVW